MSRPLAARRSDRVPDRCPGLETPDAAPGQPGGGGVFDQPSTALAASHTTPCAIVLPSFNHADPDAPYQASLECSWWATVRNEQQHILFLGKSDRVGRTPNALVSRLGCPVSGEGCPHQRLATFLHGEASARVHAHRRLSPPVSRRGVAHPPPPRHAPSLSPAEPCSSAAATASPVHDPPGHGPGSPLHPAYAIA